MIDPILDSDDKNKDGFIDYPEFIAAQQAAAAANEKQKQIRGLNKSVDSTNPNMVLEQFRCEEQIQWFGSYLPDIGSIYVTWKYSDLPRTEQSPIQSFILDNWVLQSQVETRQGVQS